MKDANGILQARGPDELRNQIDAAEPIIHARAHAPAHGATSRGPDTTRHQLPEASEIALSDRFCERHHHELRYVPDANEWRQFHDGRWQLEKTRRAEEFAKAICREAAAETDLKFANTIASAKTVSAIVRLARVDPRMLARSDQWDSDDWLLNTPRGTVNLCTRECRPHDPRDFITKCAGAAPDANCPTPTFDAFLKRTFGDDVEVVAYVQRVCGYALTGSTREQVLFFFFGTGANGKSVLLSTLGGILGDYHCSSPIETFMSSNSDRHPTELARLQGIRLATASETEKDRLWAESRVKTLTGGDVVAARFMRENYFEFTPKFKLCVAGNHKPGLRSVDEAIRRRIHVLLFNKTIPPDERDHNLTYKLRAEWPGILAWMIKGCLEWQRVGLSPPPAVASATEDYLEDEDVLGAWLSECCVVGSGHQETSSGLYQSYRTWSAAAVEESLTHKQFSQALSARRFSPGRTKGERYFRGLALKPDDG